MGSFIHEHFMLQTDTAKNLYHEYAKQLPIIDYHCHLSPKDIANNRVFSTITELWLEGDHYKWRAMRANGVKEKYITGDASAKEKFAAWAKTVPSTVGNPLYHWTHLELKNVFGITELLSEENWELVWNRCNEQLENGTHSVHELIKLAGVEVICTTDDPTDDLRYHREIANQTLPFKVYPTFRPDRGLEINKSTFVPFLQELSYVQQKEIEDYPTFLQALESRVDFFHERGCRVSDHGLGEIVYAPSTEQDIESIFQKGKKGLSVSKEEEAQFKTATLIFLATCYQDREWAMQLHFGAIRNTNTRMLEQLGADAGFDSISDQTNLATSLNGLLNAFAQKGALPRTILYNLNPSYNDVVGSTLANFQADAEIPGKIQLGSGWWFNDTKRGMIRQLTALADQGLLMNFVGMLTDSRSFVSYSRHEYFRRIVCDLIGGWVESGEVPNHLPLLKQLIENICYQNAKNYFTFKI